MKNIKRFSALAAVIALLAMPAWSGVRNPIAFIGMIVSGAINGAPLSVSAGGQLASGLSVAEVTATGTTTTSSGTDVLMSGMTVTPAAGTYLVFFGTTYRATTGGAQVDTVIYAGGAQVAASRRVSMPFDGGFDSSPGFESVSTVALVTVNGAQAIEARWMTSAGTITAYARSLQYMRVM